MCYQIQMNQVLVFLRTIIWTFIENFMFIAHLQCSHGHNRGRDRSCLPHRSPKDARNGHSMGTSYHAFNMDSVTSRIPTNTPPTTHIASTPEAQRHLVMKLANRYRSSILSNSATAPGRSNGPQTSPPSPNPSSLTTLCAKCTSAMAFPFILFASPPTPHSPTSRYTP